MDEPIKLAGEQFIKTENIIVLGLIALAGVMVATGNPQGADLAKYVSVGLLGYLGKSVQK